MTTTVVGKIQLREDTAANWTNANPVLMVGECGYESDTHKLKIGHGTAWNDLAYYYDPNEVVISDHGELTGLADDDHAQYHTDARGDARYAPLAHALNTSNPHSVTAAQVGADASGTAAVLLAFHEAAANPHSGYLTQDEADAAYAASGAVSAHAGGTNVHSIAGVTGLQTALDGKAATGHDHDTAYAPIANGVTGGDNHNHAGVYLPVGADAADLTSGEATDNYVLTADGAGGAAWEAAAVTYAGAASETHAAASKTTPVDADELPLANSESSWAIGKITFGNLKTWLKSLFAVLAGKSGGQTIIGGTGVTDKLVLQGTSGNGASAATALEVKVGNNGATTALTVSNGGTATIPLLSCVGENPTITGSARSKVNTNLYAGTSTAYGADVGGVVGIGGFIDGSSDRLFGAIAAKKESATLSNPRGYLSLYSVDGSALLVEALRISSGQNIGIGNIAPSARLHVTKTTEQLRLGYDASYYASFTVDSAGQLSEAVTAASGSTTWYRKPDGTIWNEVSGQTAGNARGAGAVDFQAVRGAATRVASGIQSVAMGANNTASNTASIALGVNNTASALQSVALGASNVASGSYSVAMGANCDATSAYSIAMGFYASNGIVASDALGGGYATGLHQMGRIPLGVITTDATGTVLNLNGTAVNRPIVPAKAAWFFKAHLVAHTSTTTYRVAAWDIVGVIARDGSNNTRIVGTPTVTMVVNESTWITVTPTVTADDTNEALAITVTGLDATTIRWTCGVYYTQTLAS